MVVLNLSEREITEIFEALVKVAKTREKGLNKTKHKFTKGYNNRLYEFNSLINLLNKIKPFVSFTEIQNEKRHLHSGNSIR
jgi:hypothetical protein